MLKLVSGDFHPGLEGAFLQRILALKKDPLAPVAVVSPSTRVLDRLQILLAEGTPGVMNVFFHTLSSLAEETLDAPAGGTSRKPILRDPFYFDAFLKSVIAEDRPFRTMSELALPDGFPTAVRSTLRDLMDAGVPDDVQTVSQAVRDAFLGRSVDIGTLLELFRLYAVYRRKLEALPVAPPSLLLTAATECVGASALLARYREILFYGFYDLTGLQTDFVRAVARAVPATLFFPCPADAPEFAFARQFRDRHLLAVVEEESVLPAVPLRFEVAVAGDRTAGADPNTTKKTTHGQAAAVQTSVISVSGTGDEAWTVASEILGLTNQGMPLHAIAVIARGRERLLEALPAALRERGIPFHTTAARPLSAFPQVSAGRWLLRRLLKNRDKEDVAAEQIETWGEIPLSADAVADAVGTFPKRGRYAVMAAALASLMDRCVHPRTEESAVVWRAMRGAVLRLPRLDDFSKSVDRAQFCEMVMAAWEAETVSEPGASVGVSLLHAEAARGLRFEVVFLLGVEERVFPRIIREDPFLRDDARRALSGTVGHKISEKLGALDEERLLFRLMTDAAERRLFLLFQRSDQEGRVVGASPFLRAFAEAHGFELERDTVTVPRGVFPRLAGLSPDRAGFHETLLRQIQDGAVSSACRLAETAGAAAAGRLERGLRVQRRLHEFSAPHEHDGLLGPMSLERALRRASLSPTRVEAYARCPYRFLAEQVMGLEPLDPEDEREAVPADLRGTMVHAVLEALFRDLDPAADEQTLRRRFEAAFDRHYSLLPAAREGEEAKNPSRAVPRTHPVIWQAIRDQTKADLWDAVQEQVGDMIHTGFRPMFFEHPLSGRIPELGDVPWRGELDRVDGSGSEARVVDYKSGSLPDTKVATACIRGLRFQPAVYLALLEASLAEEKRPVSALSFSYIRVLGERRTVTLTAEEWRSHRPDIMTALQAVLDFAKAGTFLLIPGQHCSHCRVMSACRLHHSLSAYRAEQGAGSAMRLLQTKRPPARPKGRR